MLRISSQHIRRIERIWDIFGSEIQLKAPDYWIKRSDDEIWLRVVSQVVVAGKADPADKLKEPLISARISWSKLSKMSADKAQVVIWTVLREIGARWTGKSPVTCLKTKALCRNLSFLKQFDGGPRGFLQTLSGMRSSEEMIDFISRNFSYIKLKGARDFLTTGFGLTRDRIALDVRVLGGLTMIGIEGLPKSTPTNTTTYNRLEAAIISKICVPVGITAAELDQLLFLNNEKIGAVI